jgi:ATP-dependent helicase/nuclease subunit A
MDIKKDELIDELFNELYEENNEKFLNLIDSFCSKDDKEIKEAIFNINNKLDMLYLKEQYLNDYSKNYYNDSFIDKKIKEYEDILFLKIGEINSDLNEIEEYVESDFYTKLEESLEELFLSKNYNDIKNNIKKLPQMPKGSLEEAKIIKERISKNLKELESLCIYQDTNEMKKSIYKTKDIVLTIIEIINRFDKKINKYKNDNDIYEFTDIAKMSISVLEKNKDICNELKNSLNEIMIDEYQDTSDLQDKFISLIENNNVYMVGDIKQSIYRFRNANPNLFKEKYDRYSKLDGGIKIDLNKNFRSREEVLSDINLLFDYIMDDKIGGADYSKTHRMIFGNCTYNEKGKMSHSNHIEIFEYNYDKKSEYKKEEIEIFTIASDIKNKIESKYQVFDKDLQITRDIEYKDIVILMDRATNFNLYKKIFEYLNIPLSVYKDESITNSSDLAIIKNLINLIINRKIDQSFKYSFISILRSYLYEINDQEIFKYFINNNFKESNLYNLTNIDYKELTPKELIDLLIDKFNFYEKIITVGEIDKHIAVLDYLKDISSTLTDMGYGVEDFYNYLEEIINKNYDITIPSLSDEEGVKIMTIHKSKGLEYHICYYSGLYSKFNTSDLKERFIYDRTYGIITPYIEEGIRTTFYKELLKQQYLKEEISEKIRLFYVALTRAKEKMIIVCPKLLEEEVKDEIVPLYKRLKYTSFFDILSSIQNKISLFKKEIDLSSLPLTKEYNLIKKSNYKDKIKLTNELIEVNSYIYEKEEIEEKHFSKEIHRINSKQEKENITFGKNIHSILENIDFKNPNYTGLSDFEKQKIKKIVENDILKNVINIYKEYEFIYSVQNVEYHGIIDLLLEKKNDFIIVDYKLKNISDSAYFEQLNGYKKYIENLTNKPVKIYLYSILDEELEEL